MKSSSTVDPPNENSTIAKFDCGATNKYWRKQYAITLLDVHHKKKVQLYSYPTMKLSLPLIPDIYLYQDTFTHQNKKPIYLMTYIVPH